MNQPKIEFEELKYQNHPLPRSEYAFTSDDNHNLIVFSGFKTDVELHHDLYVLDHAQGKWIKYKDAPETYARRDATAVHYKGSLYIFGGCDMKYQYTNTILKFNFQSNEWSEVTPTSGTAEKRYKHAAAVTKDGKMYVYGGNHGSGFVQGLVYFDIPNNIWVTVEQTGDIPCPRSMPSLNIFTENNEEKLLFFGGLNNYMTGFVGYCANDLYLFDINSKKWSIRCPKSSNAPEKRTGHHTTVIGENLFLFGGYSDKFLCDSYIWNSKSNSWSGNLNPERGPYYPMGIFAGGISCVSSDPNKVQCYVFGGTNGNKTVGYLDNLWRININF